MVTSRALAILCTLLAAGSGCYARSRVYVEEPPVVIYQPPFLVAIGPGVWVMHDYGAAIYYVDGYYWYWEDGYWYRSPYWDGGWVLVGLAFVPVAIVHRHHAAYVHYHGAPGARVWTVPPEHSHRHAEAKPVRPPPRSPRAVPPPRRERPLERDRRPRPRPDSYPKPRPLPDSRERPWGARPERYRPPQQPAPGRYHKPRQPPPRHVPPTQRTGPRRSPPAARPPRS
jgi:hypothetical protein